MKKTNILILLAISILSLILVSGTLAAASASRNAVLDATTPDDQPEDVQDMYTWNKVIYVNEVPYPWEPQIVIPVQTSDTVRIVDTVLFDLPVGYSIIERWIPEELMYEDVAYDPAFSEVTVGDGTLEWVVFPGHSYEMVLTKWFHVEPCTWEETILHEDFYIFPDLVESRPVTFQKQQPDLWIDATYDPEVTAGQPAYFTLNYGNSGGNEVGVTISNTFPTEAPFSSSDPPPYEQEPDGAWALWNIGELPGGDGGSIDVTIEIQAGLLPSTTIDIWDYIFDHVGIERDSVNIQFHVQEATYDLGDAPDSTNHFGTPMTAYAAGGGPPGTPADYPTVFDPLTGLPQGPLHLIPKGKSWLGPNVSLEIEADIGSDSDLWNNIYPPGDSPDLDGFDDGLIHPVLLPHCVPTQLTLEISSATLDAMYFNIWFDWNRDGDWRDQNTCSILNDASEWVIQNGIYIPPSTGSNTYKVYGILPFNTSNDPIWMRVTLSEQPAPAIGGPADGRGPAQGYLFGETEDYYLENTNITLYLPLILKSFSSPSAWHLGVPFTDLIDRIQ